MGMHSNEYKRKYSASEANTSLKPNRYAYSRVQYLLKLNSHHLVLNNDELN